MKKYWYSLTAPQTHQPFQLNPTSKKAVPGGQWIAFFLRSKTPLHDQADLKISPFPLEEGNSVPLCTEITLVLGAFAKEQHCQESPFSHVKKYRHHCAQGTAFFSAPSRLTFSIDVSHCPTETCSPIQLTLMSTHNSRKMSPFIHK